MATVGECAAHIDLSERRFHELLDQGTLTRQPRGAYDLDAVRVEYIQHLRAIASGHGSGGDGLSLTDERARLAKEQADAQEMKNARDRGELLPRGDVHMAVTSAFARVRAKLLALPTKLAPVVMGLPSPAEVKDKISDGVYEALAELAGTSIAGVPADGESGGADVGGVAGVVAGIHASATTDGEPVGRPRKAAKPRGKRGAGKVGHEPG